MMEMHEAIRTSEITEQIVAEIDDVAVIIETIQIAPQLEAEFPEIPEIVDTRAETAIDAFGRELTPSRSAELRPPEPGEFSQSIEPQMQDLAAFLESQPPISDKIPIATQNLAFYRTAPASQTAATATPSITAQPDGRTGDIAAHYEELVLETAE